MGKSDAKIAEDGLFLDKKMKLVLTVAIIGSVLRLYTSVKVHMY